jgi:hypothetical protein
VSEDWVGLRLDATDGQLGKIAAVLGDGPAWLLVRPARLGGTTAVPAAEAVEGAGSVWVPYPRDVVRKAPKVESGELDEATERGLREHYGLN